MNHKDDLYALCRMIADWAKTPGNHGGNPYGHTFVLFAEKLLDEINQSED